MSNMKTKKDDDRDIRKTESMIGGSKSSKRELGMQSVIHGIDKNPDVTAADPKAKFITKDKNRMKAAKGGRAGYKSGKTVKKKSSRKALRGSGCEIR